MESWKPNFCFFKGKLIKAYIREIFACLEARQKQERPLFKPPSEKLKKKLE
jgi:hypothetical protein